ncbi:MAG TPA: hypothetical protein DIT65_00305 [Cryomorphaceae bacterium]|nr:hypothetical protein [Cryomorphaceae bacterium]|tara:strand:+ start:1147 stop:1575 length:429 start_codon:yes stop_codon:yes gene_type:complete
MDIDQIFSITNTLAFFSWIPLIISPFNNRIRNILLISTVTLLSLTYALLFFKTFDAGAMESFSTLDGLMSLFSSKEAVLIGWIHYLTFDLLAGIFIARNAEKHQLNLWITRSIFVFTLMTGPLGFLLFVVYKTVATKKYTFE